MKIGIYDPYIDTLGGGERYIASIASCLSNDHTIFLFWDDPDILNKLNNKFSLQLQNISLTKNIFSPNVNFFRRVLETSKYDALFFVSDGSIPFLISRKNILIFQFPVNWVKINFITKIKLQYISKVICYSNFVKYFIDTRFHHNSIVIPPAVDFFSPVEKKENIILTVGRFTKAMNQKKQLELIEIFKKLHEKEKKWKFVIIGSVLPQDEDYVTLLQQKSKGYPITIIKNCSYIQLKKWYEKSKIYWHGAGYQEDLLKHPERAEHFGISTVEAMSAGVVPVVIDAGGQKEIVEHGKNGYLWSTEEQIIDYTLELINNEKKWADLSLAAIEKSRWYSNGVFSNAIKKILL